jgi:hypothetical protein
MYCQFSSDQKNYSRNNTISATMTVDGIKADGFPVLAEKY